MNEDVIRNLKFGESASDQMGNKYTRTIGGWVFSNFAGRLVFIPDNEPTISKTETVEKKGKNAK